ncbi:transcription factor HES-1-B-like [Clarias gariepinus]
MSHSVQGKTRSLQRSHTPKLSKPLMEKRRRARINHSLSRLKSLILQALHKHTSHYARLEKAVILELTVKHMRHRQQRDETLSHTLEFWNLIDDSGHSGALASYGAGFSACACDVAHFLARCECVSSVMRVRLLAHLARCLSEVHIVPPSPGAASTSSSELRNYKHRAVLLPGVRSSSVSRDIPLNSGLSPPLVSQVVRVRVRGQLWRPW